LKLEAIKLLDGTDVQSSQSSRPDDAERRQADQQVRQYIVSHHRTGTVSVPQNACPMPFWRRPLYPAQATNRRGRLGTMGRVSLCRRIARVISHRVGPVNCRGAICRLNIEEMSVVFEGAVASRVLETSRFVRVYVPPSYGRTATEHFPVLYMQDGQNVFTTVGSHVAYGWGNWGLDSTADELSGTGTIREIIIVGVDCSPQRYSEYHGAGSQASGTQRRVSAGSHRTLFERYAEFLICELKPRIDHEYRTLADPLHNGVMGSSMGGLCSLALAWQHPDIFGAAASVSGSFQVQRQHFLRKRLGGYAGPPKPVRMYLDSGIADDSDGDDGCRQTRAVADELRRIGWRDGSDLMHYIDSELLTERQLRTSGLPEHKWPEAMISQHNEFYWRRRAWRALQFLFPIV